MLPCFEPGHFADQSAKLHCKQIAKYFGFRLSNQQDAEHLIEWLVKSVLPEKDCNLRTLIEAAYNHLQHQRIVPFSSSKLIRCCNQALKEFEDQMICQIAPQLDANQKASLDALLQLSDGLALNLADLREASGPSNLESILREAEKLKRIKAIELPPSLFTSMMLPVLKKYALRVASETMSSIRALNAEKKYALLAIYCHVRLSQLIDNLVDLLSKLIHKLRTKSESTVKSRLLPDLIKIDGKPTLLLKIATATVKNPPRGC